MTTQSQLVDEMVAETLRPDMLMTISSFANQVIRELHQEPQSNAAIGFSDNLNEAQLVASAEEGFLWQLPRPHLFQRMALVWYDRFGKQVSQRTPQTMNPSINPIVSDRFYYRTGTSFAFSGYGGQNAGIKLAWYEYPRKLEYKAGGARLVKWDNDLQEFWFDPTLDTVEKREAALSQCSNWIMQRHEELVKQGLRTKIYARLGQYDRARLAYSQYEKLRPGMVSAETSDPVNVYVGA